MDRSPLSWMNGKETGSMSKNKAIVVLSLFTLLLFFLILGPIFTIWSINVVFKLEIPVNFKTWIAVLWIMTVIHGIRIVLKREED
jgi:hypothetical protein